MRKIEMVRCAVRSPNDPGHGDDAKSQRFVPSEIFRLWQYLMVNVKGFSLSDTVTGVWMDEEMYSRERQALPNVAPDHVVEVSFTYVRETDVGRPVIRYFPQDHLETIMSVFLKHFSKEHIHGHTRKIPGFFVGSAS